MAEDIWTVSRILEWIEGYLDSHGDENPRLSAQWLVAEALGVSRMQLFLDLERPLASDERAVLRDYTRRRGTGEPLQYITGEAAFRHISVKVSPGVLIPRPETEVLVSEALALLPRAEKPQDAFDAALLQLLSSAEARQSADAEPQRLGGPGSAIDAEGESSKTPGSLANAGLLVADICTGSGCIACSIAHEHPLTHVIATDVSPVAASLARENAARLGLAERVEVIECDLGEGIDPALAGAFDLVVSNPPYVPTEVLAGLPREVADFEPELALDGGPDGLDVFRRLIGWCVRALKPGGAFAFELHETCLDEAADLAAHAGLATIRIVEDLSGRPRVLVGRKA